MNKTRGDSSNIVWSALILVCVVLAVFTIMFASCAPGPSDDAGTSSSASPLPDEPEDSGATTEPDTSVEPDNSPTPTATVLGETEDMGQEYLDKFVFLGDSTTYGLAYYDVVNDNQVWTPKNGTLTLNRWSIDAIVYPDEDTEIPIVDAVTKKQPEYMMLTLGVNGVSFMDEEYFTTEYTALVQAIQAASPNTKIILNSVYPVGVNYATSTGITNPKIEAANLWIQTVAENTGVKFLNTASILKDENGYLKEGYHTDNIHLSKDTFGLVINYIRTHGYS